MAAQQSDTTTPVLSVVIASVNGFEYITQCLRSLAAQHEADRAEVIVAECSGDDTARRLAEAHPWAIVIPVAAPQTIPRLRSLGIRQAKGEIVAATEDHCVFPADWFGRILEAHRTHSHCAIGGAVENGSQARLTDWAAYICEYGKFMLPFPAGPATDLPGPNVSYKRLALERLCGDLLERGVWENVLHARLMERGQELRMDPAVIVHHVKRFGFWDFLTQRYYFGRSFAATRVAEAPLRTRLFFVTVAPLLPPLLLARYARWFIVKRRFRRQLVLALPLLVVFTAAWSVGEFFGYAFGDGGASLRVK